MSRFTRGPKRSDWLGLGDASRLLGVAPETLRRWSDSGRVAAFTTPGGHRRYRRTVLERLLPSERLARPPLLRSGMTPARLARAYRREARGAEQTLPWLTELSDQQRVWFRTHGRSLAEALLGHLDAADEALATETLSTATSEAAEYGRMAARIGVSLSQTVEGFLQFRRPFLHQLGVFARQRGIDVAATTALIERTERAMDRLLLAVMSAYSIKQSNPSGGVSADDVEGVR